MTIHGRIRKCCKNEPSNPVIFAALGISILTRFDTQIFVGYVVTLSKV